MPLIVSRAMQIAREPRVSGKMIDMNTTQNQVKMENVAAKTAKLICDGEPPFGWFSTRAPDRPRTMTTKANWMGRRVKPAIPRGYIVGYSSDGIGFLSLRKLQFVD